MSHISQGAYDRVAVLLCLTLWRTIFQGTHNPIHTELTGLIPG